MTHCSSWSSPPDALAGGKRHLAQFPAFGGERFTLGADIGALLSWIAARWDKG
ncbi:hypothetical protein MJL81_29590, partial [Salmonella enterica subsp. enterica serovar Anatum]|nr:hypothetical protein [Salmonella enterica subsp. enterica serovar Anatum]